MNVLEMDHAQKMADVTTQKENACVVKATREAHVKVRLISNTFKL